MSVAFLYPLVWLGALAIGVPIWLHFRRRFERNLIRFSALRFLEDQPVARRSPLRLRDLLLFALRVAGVLLLVAAFAWPYRRELLTGIPRESRVYLLDNTLSHQADGGFERARDRLIQEIAKAGPETQVAVIELTASPRLIFGFGTEPLSVAQHLRALEPSFQRGSYTAAFRLADTILANALGERKVILVYSDNQENQWTEVLKASGFLQKVEVIVPRTDKTSAANLALARPRAQRAFTGDKAVVDFSVELYHQGRAEKCTVTVQANGREVLRKAVQVAGQPTRMLLTVQWETDPLLEVTGEATVTGEPDALPGDNRVFFSLPPMKEGRVLLLARSPFLHAALSPDVMRGYWAMRVLEPTQAAEELRAVPFADVLCVESVCLGPPDVRNLVLHYLNSARGVLLLVNELNPATRASLGQFGFELGTATNAASASSTFRYVFTDHPVFRPFRSPDFGNLMEIKVHQYHQLKASQAVPLIFSESGDALLFQATNTKGNFLLSAFGFDREGTNWPLHPTFIPFLDLCLQYAKGERTTPATFEPGEMLVLNLPPEDTGGQFVLREGNRELSRGPVKDGRIEFAVPSKPGLYTLSYGSDVLSSTVLSVNPSPLESELTYLESPESAAARLIRSSPNETRAEPTTTGAELTRSQILRQRLWWLALLAGLVVLLTESVWLVARKERV